MKDTMEKDLADITATKEASTASFTEATKEKENAVNSKAVEEKTQLGFGGHLRWEAGQHGRRGQPEGGLDGRVRGSAGPVRQARRRTEQSERGSA
mmetsp:Transcript_92162/g.240542  ORF Transcript_92162/g.240542 Transcript_92162/m.240542 type:complete len:95 (-) Transcript_92162:176-460(-)